RTDPRAHERPSLSLRHLCPHHQGDKARLRQDRGRRPMTMHTEHTELPFSRRDLLKGGGALIIGFTMAGLPAPALAARGDVARPADRKTVDSWIAINSDNTATIYFGKCELGQGNTTGLLQIAGEELDLDMNQLKAVRLDTNVTPNQGATSSSSSIHKGGPQL